MSIIRFFCILFLSSLNQACLPSKSHIYSEIEEFFEYRTDCGVSAKSHYFGNSLNRRIINGNESDPDFFPWIVTLTNYLTKNCGGTLISSQHVITAAHCIQRSVKEIKVIIGLSNFNNLINPENIFSVSKVKIHPEYSGNKNDIAILKLSKEAKQTPICLPVSSNYGAVFGKNVVAAGWGNYDGLYKGKLNKKLKKTTLNIINGDKKCFNSNDFYCLIDLPDKKSNICYGDSGGPLMFYANKNWYLYGIASMITTHPKTNNCLHYSPSYFIMVPKYLDWINKNLI